MQSGPYLRPAQTYRNMGMENIASPSLFYAQTRLSQPTDCAPRMGLLQYPCGRDGTTQVLHAKWGPSSRSRIGEDQSPYNSDISPLCQSYKELYHRAAWDESARLSEHLATSDGCCMDSFINVCNCAVVWLLAHQQSGYVASRRTKVNPPCAGR